LKTKSRRDLEQALGHRFKRKALLEQALTHSSARDGNSAASDNERLEFLGDRVLGLVIAEVICEQFPRASEGAGKPAPRSPMSSASVRNSS
jgi:ribonuclease III